MSDFVDSSKGKDKDAVNAILQKIPEGKNFLEIPQTDRLNILRQILELTKEFILRHKYTNSETGSITYMLSEVDEQLLKIYRRISADMGQLRYEHIEREAEIGEEMELVGGYLEKLESIGLDDYYDALEKRIKEGAVRH